MKASTRWLALLAAVVLAACGSTPAPSTSGTLPGLGSAGPSSGPIATASGATASPPPTAPSTASPASPGETGIALATPPIEDGDLVPTQLVPPILEEGDVPAPADPNPPVTGTLTVGSATEIAAQTIGPSGGTIAAGGLEIRVPGGALAADTRFVVRQAPINAHSFGDLVTPITPLYEVDDGEAALGAPVTVVLPAAIPAGRTAMAFWYDATAGTLTPLAPLTQDSTTLTVGATHFSKVFGGLVDIEKLPATVDSGFRPGQDDWQFTNYGSFITPTGQCDGMSTTAIWYYVTQRRGVGASPLYGLFDNNGAPTKTPALWQDDSDGYRLTSTVQADPLADSARFNFYERSLDAPDGRAQYAAFRTAIGLTGRPQYIAIQSADKQSFHAMVVYRVTPERLFVADPNYPGRLRTIRYDTATGTLGPYRSGDSAGDIAANGPTIYTRFAYVPADASSTDARLAARWAELEGGTAGDTAFPTYDLEVLAGKDAQGKDVWAPLVDGYRTSEKKLTVRLLKVRRNVPSTMAIYRGTSSTPIGPLAWRQTIDLEDGDNPLGIAIYGEVVVQEPGKPAQREWDYIDFVRLTVTSGESTDWQLADVQVKHTGVSMNQDYTWSWEGDGRGGITTVWTTDVGTPATARMKASWQIPDTLTPGTTADVTGDLGVTLDFASRAGEFCAGGLYQVGPEDGWLSARAFNETGAGPDLAGYTIADTQRMSILSTTIGCDTKAGTMVSSATVAGSFTVPDRLVAPAGQSAWLVVLFSVSQDYDTVTVAYIYK